MIGGYHNYLPFYQYTIYRHYYLEELWVYKDAHLLYI
jgi:hypothetical protein